MYYKTFFDGSNLIKGKLFEEWDGNGNFKRYMQTKAGKNKIKQLVERYFAAIEFAAEVKYVEYSEVKTELTIQIETNEEPYKINNGPIYFY